MAAGSAMALGRATGPSSGLIGVNAGAAYATAGPEVGSTAGPADTVRRNEFTIGGNVSGLYPGKTAPLVLRITNPNGYAITVTSVSTQVTSLQSGCGSTNVAVSNFSGHLYLPANGTTHVTVLAHMAHSAPDACQGAHFLLTYSGTGVT